MHDTVKIEFSSSKYHMLTRFLDLGRTGEREGDRVREGGKEGMGAREGGSVRGREGENCIVSE